MKFKGTKISKRTIALFAAALVLLVSGGTMGTKAALNVTGVPYEEAIQTDEVAVQITENGKEVGTKDPITIKTEPTIFKSVPTKFEPGKTENANVGVSNTGSADAYVRVMVHKYWLKKNKEGELEKSLALSPSYIEPIATSKWKAVKGASGDKETETMIYYYQGKLGADTSAQLFTGIRINEKVLTNGRVKAESSTTEGGVTVINYIYEYDGLKFVVEAEAQAVQTHNAKEAIKSVWGVDSSVVGL